MLLEIGTKSNSITEALLVLSFALSVCSNNVVKSISPGHPKSPLLSLPIPGLGPVPKLASPDDNIIPCENSKLSEISEPEQSSPGGGGGGSGSGGYGTGGGGGAGGLLAGYAGITLGASYFVTVGGGGAGGGRGVGSGSGRRACWQVLGCCSTSRPLPKASSRPRWPFAGPSSAWPAWPAAPYWARWWAGCSGWRWTWTGTAWRTGSTCA